MSIYYLTLSHNRQESQIPMCAEQLCVYHKNIRSNWRRMERKEKKDWVHSSVASQRNTVRWREVEGGVQDLHTENSLSFERRLCPSGFHAVKHEPVKSNGLRLLVLNIGESVHDLRILLLILSLLSFFGTKKSQCWKRDFTMSVSWKYNIIYHYLYVCMLSLGAVAL